MSIVYAEEGAKRYLECVWCGHRAGPFGPDETWTHEGRCKVREHVESLQAQIDVLTERHALVFDRLMALLAAPCASSPADGPGDGSDAG